MEVSFSRIVLGDSYSRPTLAKIWGYTAYQAISRGVVTPRNDNKIILFVTEEKQATAEQYVDSYSDGRLTWEGPTDHFAENRMVNAHLANDEIHLFHRRRHHSEFTYLGKLTVNKYKLNMGKPSYFEFDTISK